MTRGRLLVLAGLAAPALVHAALGPRYGGELRIGAVGSGARLEPRSAAGPTSRLLLGMVHETLVHAGPDDPTPGLAESWTPGRDGRDWTLALQESLEFHDGTALTAADAVRTVQRFLKSDSPAAAVLAQSLEGAEVVDARRLLLKFRAPVSPRTLLPLASPAAAVISEKGTACGPFVPTSTAGNDLLFVAFAAHVRGRPYLDRVKVRLVSDERRLLAARRVDRLDVAEGSAGVSHAPGIVVLALDPAHPPFDSKTLRLAVATSIDREALARRTLVGAVAWPRLLPQVGEGVDPPIARVEMPAAARGVTRVVLAVDRSLPRLASQRIVAHFADLGLITQVRPVDPDAVRQEPADARLLLFEPELAEPILALHELATLVEKTDVPVAAMESDPTVRGAMALEIEQRLLAVGALIPLARLSRSTAIAPHVHGLHTDGYALSLEDAWILP